MPETTILFAQSVVVLAFVYLTAILVGAVVHFISSRKDVYWVIASFLCALTTFIVLWWFALPATLEVVYYYLTSTSQVYVDNGTIWDLKCYELETLILSFERKEC